MGRRQRSVLITMLGANVIGLATLAGCSPLPGNTLDPIFLKYGTKPALASAQPAAPPTKGSAPVESKTAGTSVWVGRYQDSRGGGDVAFSLVRGATTVSGTWRLRTGGGGPVTAVAEATGRRLQLRMENTTPECPGTFEGWMELTETTLIGAYRGKDCEGPVSDGRLELRLK